MKTKKRGPYIVIKNDGYGAQIYDFETPQEALEYANFGFGDIIAKVLDIKVVEVGER